MKCNKVLLSSLSLCLAGQLQVSQANSVNLLFVVDESGSMSTEHSFLQAQAPSIANGLNTVGVTDLNFGLVGFGDGNAVPHLFDINGSSLGSASDFASAAMGLNTNGSTEDGYAGIDFALQQFTGLTGSTFVIMVSDEDRDILSDLSYPGASTFTASSIEQSLLNSNARLVSIVDQNVLDDQSGQALVINNSDQVYVADGLGDVVRSEGGQLGTSVSGNTTADYSQLALDTGGIVADLNQLRLGGTTAESFTIAFIDSLVNIVLVSTGGNLVQLAENGNQLDIAALVASVITNPQNSNQSYFQSLLTLSTDQQRLLLRLAELQGMRQVGNSLIGGAHTYTFSMDDHFTVTARESERQREAEDYEQRPKWNGFAQLVGNDADIDSTSSTVGGDSDNYGGLVGIDYRWSQNLVTGVAFGYKDDEIDYSNSSRSEIDTQSILVYSAWSPKENLSIEGTVGYGSSDIDTFRRTTLLGTPTDARGETNADTFSASIGARYRINKADFTFTPYARLQWAYVDLDGYTESGGGALAATVEGYDIDSVQGILGFRSEYFLPVGDLNLIPYVSAEWLHEFDSTSAFVDTTLANDTLRLETDAMDSDYGRIAAGSSVELSRDTSLLFSVIQSVGNDFIDTTSVRLSVHHSF